MKKQLIATFCAATFVVASSFTLVTDCSGFEQFTKGAQFTMTNYDGKGKVTSTVNSTCENVTVSGDKTIADITAVMNDGEGKQTNSSSYTLTCAGASYYMDMKGIASSIAGSQAKGMELAIDGDMLDYPSGMTAGQSLPSGKVIIKASKDGSLVSTTTVNIKDRKCEKTEDKTTTAGTWSCYKITYVVEGSIDMGVLKMPIPARNVTEWFSFKVGQVRSEYFRGEKLESYSELTKFTKPQ